LLPNILTFPQAPSFQDEAVSQIDADFRHTIMSKKEEPDPMAADLTKVGNSVLLSLFLTFIKREHHAQN
jgi:hypothetical protein